MQSTLTLLFHHLYHHLHHLLHHHLLLQFPTKHQCLPNPFLLCQHILTHFFRNFFRPNLIILICPVILVRTKPLLHPNPVPFSYVLHVLSHTLCFFSTALDVKLHAKFELDEYQTPTLLLLHAIHHLFLLSSLYLLTTTSPPHHVLLPSSIWTPLFDMYLNRSLLNHPSLL